MPDNTEIIKWGGLAIIVTLVFVETGLLIGMVVPGGETLLFTAGLLVSTDVLGVSIWLVWGCCVAAAIAGDISGYYIGNSLGSKLYDKTDTWYFKKDYLKRAEEFYDEKGKWALVLGKFVPFIRTLNPFVSGTTDLSFHIFILFTAIGILLYVSGMIALGYFLGQVIPGLEKYLIWILIGLVAVMVTPVVVTYVKEKRKGS